jgi:3D-(3,5/4)-trihydroxycyclohexane-1,2-dione acylhydrolase (decyclizing)
VGDSAGEDVEALAIDFAANARSLGAEVIPCQTYEDFTAALQVARAADRTTVITIQIDRYVSVPGYDSWWDVPVAEVSEMPSVQESRREWETMRAAEKFFFGNGS